eukprot:3348751-Pyramimonas_sp.AAC.1
MSIFWRGGWCGCPGRRSTCPRGALLHPSGRVEGAPYRLAINQVESYLETDKDRACRGRC